MRPLMIRTRARFGGKMKLIGAVFIFVLNLVRAENKLQACPTISHQTIDTQSIKWQSYKNAVVTSIPRCVNSRDNYILALCQNGAWSIEPADCVRLSSDTSCAEGLIPLEEYCALVTPPQCFDEPCPAGFLKYYNHTRLDPAFEYWSPTRKIDDVFVHTASDFMYGREFIAPNQRTDCFVFSNGTAMPKFCNESYHQICVIPKRPFLDAEFESKLEIKLKFDRKRGKILLNIYNPSVVLKKLDNTSYDAVYCFTNADDVELKTPLKIKRVISKEKLRVYQISIKYEHPGEYWCEAFDIRQRVVRSNTLIAYKKKKGNEYSLRAVFKAVCLSDSATMEEPTEPDDNNFKENCTVVDGQLIMNYVNHIQFRKYFHHTELSVRVMKIFGKADEDVDLILHLTTMRYANVIGEYYKLLGFLHSIPDITILWFRSADYCFPETTQITEELILSLEWLLTPISEERCPDKLCLNEKAIPYKRKCLGNFINGAFWEAFNHTCNQNVAITENTENLYNMSLNTELSPLALLEIQNITSDAASIIPLDVYLIANIMNNVEASAVADVPSYVVLDNVIKTIEHLMDVNRTVLMESQIELNATDTLLDSIEKYFEEDSPISKLEVVTKLNAGDVFLSVEPKFILHIAKPFLSNVHGVALYKNSEEASFSKNMIKSIGLNETFDDLDDLEQLELATYVPMELLELIAEENGNAENITVITTIFYNDNLFNSQYAELGVPQTKVISVKIPDYGLYLDEPLPLLFRENYQVKNIESFDNFTNSTFSIEANSTCAYWQYGEYATNKTGHWSNLGGTLEPDSENVGNATLTKCYFNHLTHFALLITNQRLVISEPENEFWEEFQTEFYAFHDNLLSLITLTGSVLSLTGILGIFLTAVCFSRWRQKTGSKILLQLSLTIMLEIVVVHIAGDEHLAAKTQLCTIVGICLHYVVLAKCSWMFVSAILQYLRFVKIFQVLPNRLILKAMILAWGFPLIPVGLVAGLMPMYNAAARHFCYPTDLALYLGLFAPVAVIVFSNLVVFILIMRNVFNPNVEVKPRSSYKNATAQNKLQIYLGILLFFMLGLPWVFGIMAEILVDPLKLVCMYLFCLTATLQGCVIFLFYVVLDRDTRQLWINAFNRLVKNDDAK